MKQIKVIYDPLDCEALLLADGQVESHVNSVIQFFEAHDGDIEVTYASSLPITQFRVAIKEGIIPVDDIQFIYDGVVVKHRTNGSLTCWPKGLCDYESKLLRRLVRGA